MSDISQVKLGSILYNIKDKTARERMIDNTTNSNVSAIINFINGIKVNGNSVISQATADVVSIPADDEPGIDLTVDQQGKAHFSFKIPKAKDAHLSASFSNNVLYLGEVIDTN